MPLKTPEVGFCEVYYSVLEVWNKLFNTIKYSVFLFLLLGNCDAEISK
uniref:Uncharacterized protein n=1 Tax=Rhizophora mucronata TaxID=61149 RepID=A0A2P2QJW8_RHIMU